jgi:uncharacterized membrane protein YkoI
MASARSLTLVVVLCGLTGLPAEAPAQERGAAKKLPEAVKKTFEARFPRAEIEKIDAEEENGVMVYDIEFKDGDTEKETDITADGTMLEFTVVVAARAVPEVAMKPIREAAAAAGATMKRIERIEIAYETKDGKAIKLPKAVTHYAVELQKGKQESEIVVAADGKVLEPAKFDDKP